MGRLLEGMGPSICHPPQVIYPPIILPTNNDPQPSPGRPRPPAEGGTAYAPGNIKILGDPGPALIQHQQ